ncbi:hypothetical protein ES703_42950 [subsurface metagenome]
MRDLWKWIEKKAFNPRDENDKHTWLRCFHRFLPRLWETGIFDWLEWNKPENTVTSWCSYRFNDGYQLKLETLSLKPLRDSEIGFFYSINKVGEGFSVRLFYSRGCFQLDYDKNYLFEFRNDLNHNIDMNEITKENIAEVIRKRIHHPALHTHLKSEDGEEYYQHLRFGFATNNPFVILYQVAFQVIDYQINDSGMKKNEVSRLAGILHSNRNNP